VAATPIQHQHRYPYLPVEPRAQTRGTPSGHSHHALQTAGWRPPHVRVPQPAHPLKPARSRRRVRSPRPPPHCEQLCAPRRGCASGMRAHLPFFTSRSNSYAANRNLQPPRGVSRRARRRALQCPRTTAPLPPRRQRIGIAFTPGRRRGAVSRAAARTAGLSTAPSRP
jgi:hypothetical protein